MLRRRKLIAAMCVVFVPGTLSVTLSYAFRLRSDAYRQDIEQKLTNRLRMAVTVQSIRPLTLRDRVLENVQVRLGKTGEQVFACAQAIWKTTASSDSPRMTQDATRPSNRTSSSLELRDGWLLVGAAAWQPTQYKQILAGGLGHDFAALGLKEVHVRDLDLKFAHPSAPFTADDAAGTVLFDDYGEGHASLTCLKLNGVAVDRPVSIIARFTPGKRLVFQEVRLTVPSIKLASLGLDGLLAKGGTSRGEFEGSIAYRQVHDNDITVVEGALHNAELADFTTALPGGPFHGRVNAALDSATFRDRKLESLAIHGELSDLRIGEVLPGLVEPDAPGVLDLQIDQMRWVSSRLVHLSIHGTCSDLSLEAVSRILDTGHVTGTAKVIIRSLLIVNDELRLADIEIHAVPPREGPGLIDRALIADAANKRFGLNIEAALPEHIEYTRFGARLILEDEQLRVLGTHGRDGQTILTVKLFGQPVGLVRQPSEPVAVPDLLPTLRQRAAEIDAEQLRTWWEHLRPADDDQHP
jgi:hypothetical protein